MAELVDADYLFILTAVDRVCINFNKPDQKELKEILPPTKYKNTTLDQSPGKTIFQV